MIAKEDWIKLMHEVFQKDLEVPYEFTDDTFIEDDDIYQWETDLYAAISPYFASYGPVHVYSISNYFNTYYVEFNYKETTISFQFIFDKDSFSKEIKQSRADSRFFLHPLNVKLFDEESLTSLYTLFEHVTAVFVSFPTFRLKFATGLYIEKKQSY